MFYTLGKEPYSMQEEKRVSFSLIFTFHELKNDKQLPKDWVVSLTFKVEISRNSYTSHV